MGELRERMAADLRLRGLSENTQKTYLGCVRQFAAHFGRSPAELGEAEIRTFLAHLACERRASTSTRHVYVGALHFLYRVTLGQPADRNSKGPISHNARLSDVGATGLGPPGAKYGLPSYNDAREAVGLPRARNFADVTSDPALRARLAAAYDDVDAVDLWVGGLAEDPLPGALVGELTSVVLADQFAALRDGDRLWYARTLDAAERARVESTRLSDVIRRNTAIGRELPDDVFRVG
jgi:hypothetical protein